MSLARSSSFLLRSLQQPRPFTPTVYRPNGTSDGGKPIDWPKWLRIVERKRRLTSQARAAHLPQPFFHLGTLASFRLEGLDVNEKTILASVQPGRVRFRSRASQRIRSHIAILHHIERALGRCELLKTEAVIRWYTQISSGLSITALDEPTMTRLDQFVRRMNSPHLRLQPAVQEIARLHAQSLGDPLVPSFNGILARLLLQYHLGRCGLPPVVFDPDVDAAVLDDEPRLLARLLELINESYDLLLNPPAPTPGVAALAATSAR